MSHWEAWLGFSLSLMNSQRLEKRRLLFTKSHLCAWHTLEIRHKTYHLTLTNL
jgi:hypothetical protein